MGGEAIARWAMLAAMMVLDGMPPSRPPPFPRPLRRYGYVCFAGIGRAQSAEGCGFETMGGFIGGLEMRWARWADEGAGRTCPPPPPPPFTAIPYYSVGRAKSDLRKGGGGAHGCFFVGGAVCSLRRELHHRWCF